LDACTAPVREFLEASASLGVQFNLHWAALLAKVTDPAMVVDAAVAAGLLQVRGTTMNELSFVHPMIHAALYDHMSWSRRARLHREAAAIVEDEAEALRHRVAAANGPEPGLIEDLEAFAAREAARGAWASAASTLAMTSRLSPTLAARRQLLTRAVDAMTAAGDLVRARPYIPEIMSLPEGALRDGTLGHLAVLSGDPAEAEARLRAAWRSTVNGHNNRLTANIAQRNALHAMGRMRPLEMVEWAQQAISVAAPNQPERADASAMLGIGLGFLGRASEGLAVQEQAIALSSSSDAVTAGGLALRMAHGWLHLATDEITDATVELTEAAPAALRTGSYRVALYAFAWLARSRYCTGAWDEAVVDADRALALVAETEHEWLRPLTYSIAVAVPAARGDWETATAYADAAAAGSNAYELMILADGMTRAQLASAQGDHQAVLRALEPVLGIMPREAVEEPGFWPWQDLYADALVSAGRLDDADAFLRPRETLAAARAHSSTIARLARVRGRLEALAGRFDNAEEAFSLSLTNLRPLPLPFERAQLELAWGKALRRDGQRRAAASRLRSAAEKLTTLRAQPFLERCERELMACGLTPAKRKDYDPNQLTPHELAVANLVVQGMSNRQVAAEIMISMKTVQAHLTRIYAKVGVASRGELAARMRDQPG
jgi:ATP/maltotriose-dependent transcriptional regulator MalT